MQRRHHCLLLLRTKQKGLIGIADLDALVLDFILSLRWLFIKLLPKEHVLIRKLFERLFNLIPLSLVDFLLQSKYQLC